MLTGSRLSDSMRFVKHSGQRPALVGRREGQPKRRGRAAADQRTELNADAQFFGKKSCGAPPPAAKCPPLATSLKYARSAG